MKNKKTEAIHWADQTARRIISEKGNKKKYVCAAGITPSGVVHIGNFREIITVDLVARALKDLGKQVRFIYSWDDYDAFRKVPKGWPKQKELEKELRKPIIDVFDLYGKEKSYARYNEVAVEKELPRVGVNPEFISQAKQYRKCIYKKEIKKALENASKIRKILDQHRKEPLPKTWLPLEIFDPDTKTDEVSDIKYLKRYKVSYKDKKGKTKTFDFSKDGRCKLLWRQDWPMRWYYEKVDFEPGGKDHSTPGGSFDTGKEIVKEVYNFEAPLYVMYDFVIIKGVGGKMSSSAGNVITLKDVLEIYEPAIVRWLFAGTRPSAEFSISFGIDVISLYEEFDRVERIYYKKEKVNERKYQKQKRIYELSAVDPKIPKKTPFQPSFRHLTNVLQVYEMNISNTINYYKKELKNSYDKQRLKTRAECAKNWLEKYAPDEFKFTIQDKPKIKVKGKLKEAFLEIAKKLKKKKWKDKQLHEEFYKIIKDKNIDNKEFFKTAYNILINKDKGPQLANFILTIGKERVAKLFEKI